MNLDQLPHNVWSFPVKLCDAPNYEDDCEEAMMVQATRCKILSRQYFAHGNVDANKIRLRHPVNPVADVLKMVDLKSNELQLSINKSTYITSKINTRESSNSCVRFLGIFTRLKQYDSVINLADKIVKTDPRLTIPMMYGYIASLCVNDEVNEFKYSNLIENSFIHPKDYSHFFHLFDEIMLVSSSTFKPLLLQLLLEDITDLQNLLIRRAPITPNITTEMNQCTIVKHRQEGYTQSTIDKIRSYLKYYNQSMPDMYPRDEAKMSFYNGIEKIFTNPGDLISNGKYHEAVVLCSSILHCKEMNENRSDIYICRAIAYFKMNKFINALRDCENASRREPNPYADQLRDGIYNLMGASKS